MAAPDRRLVEAAKKQDREGVQALLTQKVDVNVAQADGATALHWAAHWDDAGTAGLLIAAGADVNAANELGVVPLHLACANANPAVAARWNPDPARKNAAPPSPPTPETEAGCRPATSCASARREQK